MSSEDNNEICEGLGISPGLALGVAYVYRDILQRDIERRKIGAAEVQKEWERIESALSNVVENLKRTAAKVQKRVDNNSANIFLAQAAILQDTALKQELRKALDEEKVNAEHIVKQVLLRWEHRFREMDRDEFKQRGDDMADLARRLVLVLQGIQAHMLEHMPEGSVLTTRRLLPSDTVFLSRHSAAAVAVEHAGPASHAAILTRELGIPGVAQVANLLDHVRSGDTVFVDGDGGRIVVRPDPSRKSELFERVQEHWASSVSAKATCREPAVTQDGRKVQVLANVGCKEDVEHAAAVGADGIGLYRTEHVYLARQSPPSEKTVVNQLNDALSAMKGKPVTMRLLDAGGDKKVPFLDIVPEHNPFLGRRGIRILLDNEDLLTCQLRAFLRLSAEHAIRIMIPMVTTVDDIIRTRDLMLAAARDLDIESPPPLGAMIETPAAALCVEDIARHADFLSVGTNDLTQYTMVAGRENPLVSRYFIDHHPAVMRLLKVIVAEAGSRPVSVCGELAGRQESLRPLLDLGISILSVAPPLIPEIKESIRQV